MVAMMPQIHSHAGSIIKDRAIFKYENCGLAAQHIFYLLSKADPIFSEVDGIDRVPADWNPCFYLGYLHLVVVGNNRCMSVSGSAPVDAIEIHKEHRQSRTIEIGDAALQTRAHKRQVGVTVGRLISAFFLRQLGTKGHLIVTVTGVTRKELLEAVDKTIEPFTAIVKTMGEPLLQKTGSRVVRTIEHPPESFEHVTVQLLENAAYIDHVIAKSRTELEPRRKGLTGLGLNHHDLDSMIRNHLPAFNS